MAKEAYAEGCDSTTNSNCIETNSNTVSKVDSNLTVPTYLTPKPSTTSENCTGLVTCLHSPVVCVPFDSNHVVAISCAVACYLGFLLVVNRK